MTDDQHVKKRYPELLTTSIPRDVVRDTTEGRMFLTGAEHQTVVDPGRLVQVVLRT
jgi:hypothetical protein